MKIKYKGEVKNFTFLNHSMRNLVFLFSIGGKLRLCNLVLFLVSEMPTNIDLM